MFSSIEIDENNIISDFQKSVGKIGPGFWVVCHLLFSYILLLNQKHLQSEMDDAHNFRRLANPFFHKTYN